jgi:TolB-like protein/cytochrome c-type biogenesis protein CcmH/NrfG
LWYRCGVLWEAAAASQNDSEQALTFRFEDFLLDTERRELRRDGALIAVEPQVFDLIDYLVQRRDRVVTKDELLDAIWGGRIVSESTLTSRINAARRALNDSGDAQRLIRTIARRGFRFIGAVEAQPEPPAPAASPDIAAPQPPGDAIGSRRDRPAIAVLPFTNMSGDPEQEYFSDGISEDLIAALSKQRWFLVIARNSSFIYKGKAVHLRQVAEELGVRYVVEGSVRKSGDRVRITAQLNDVVTGSHVWSERYDRELTDVFAVQDEITESIVSSIQPQLFQAENFRVQRKAPDNLDAWDLVMRAMSHHWRVTRSDYLVAQALLEKAIALDPSYGQALGLLATNCMFNAHFGWIDMAAAMAAAKRAALAAIAADSEDPWAHNALGHVHLFARRFGDSLAEFELALQLNPNFAAAQGYYGLSLSYSGRWQDAIEAAGRALRLSPRDPYSAIYLGIAAYARFLGGDYDEAMRLSREALRLRSDFVGAHRVLTAACGMAADAETAAAALQACRRAQPNLSLAWIADHLPIRLDGDRAHYLEGFRRAGLG